MKGMKCKSFCKKPNSRARQIKDAGQKVPFEVFYHRRYSAAWKGHVKYCMNTLGVASQAAKETNVPPSLPSPRSQPRSLPGHIRHDHFSHVGRFWNLGSFTLSCQQFPWCWPSRPSNLLPDPSYTHNSHASNIRAPSLPHTITRNLTHAPPTHLPASPHRTFRFTSPAHYSKIDPRPAPK